MDVVEDQASGHSWPKRCSARNGRREESEVQGAIQELEERAIEGRLRDLRALIAEAERRGDFAELALLTQQKLELDRALRELQRHKTTGTVGFTPDSPRLPMCRKTAS